MACVPVWFLCLGDNAQQFCAPLVAAMERSGLQVVHEYTPRVPLGVIVSDDHHPEVKRLLTDASRNHGHQVLLITRRTAIEKYETVWLALSAGAADMITMDDDHDVVADAVAKLHRWATVQELLSSPTVRDTLIGGSRIWRSLLADIVDAAYFTQDGILLAGESGTGKERVARAIHALDQRSEKGAFVVVDCTTISPELGGSELFGHERGAFTGAVNARDGALTLADRGTLFLDEVGDMPLTLQALLLRAVQEGEYKRVGSNEWRRSHFRLVCATHRDLPAEVKAGRFREDLYYRIAGHVFRLPALRERGDDILELTRHFIREHSSHSVCDRVLNSAVAGFLEQREYPGNIRELRQLVLQMVHRHAGSGPISPGCIPIAQRPSAEKVFDRCHALFDEAVRLGLSLGMDLETIEKQANHAAKRRALAHAGDESQRAAIQLGVDIRTIQKWKEQQKKADRECCRSNGA